ncbi:hypothetical protein GGI05_006429, partial [Coemansia sp. RSA 2603]
DARAQAFRQMVDRLQCVLQVPVDDVSGRPMDAAECLRRRDASLAALQLAAFETRGEALDPLINDSGARLADPEVLAGHLAKLSLEDLQALARAVGVRTRLPWPSTAEGSWTTDLAGEIPVAAGADMAYTRDFLLYVFCQHYAHKTSIDGDEAAADSALLRNERLLLGDAAMSDASMRSRHGAAPGFAEYPAPSPLLPRLGLQFLSPLDYVHRNLELLQVEWAFGVHEDMADAVSRLQPADDQGTVVFNGWARMAMPLRVPLHVTDVQPPRVGERAPRRVRAEISVDLASYAESVRREWDVDVRAHDTLFLLHVQPPSDSCRLGVAAVRVCEVEARLDHEGAAGVRRFCVLLDPAQYQVDVERRREDVYAKFNVVLRRRPQEGGVLGVLNTVRALAAHPPKLPAWLAPIFLGYGDPAQATALHSLGGDSCSPAAPLTVNMGDTFVSAEHLRSSFAETHAEVCFDTGEFTSPCVVEFGTNGELRVRSQRAPLRGPMALQAVRGNAL